MKAARLLAMVANTGWYACRNELWMEQESFVDVTRRVMGRSSMRAIRV
jgi:hypothetical protein